MTRILDWMVTVPVLIGFGASLLFYDITGRIARLFGQRPFEWTMACLQRSLVEVFRLTGTRITVERHPDIRPHAGYAIVSNHQSLFDIALIGGILFTNYPKYVAKKELARWIPAISLNLRHGGNAVIDRKDRRQAVAAIRKVAADAQARGVSVVIFPEGTRSRDGELQTFKPAGTRVMLEAADRLPVVPVAIDGSWRLLAHNLLPVPFRAQVRIRFGEPIQRAAGDAAQVMEEARSWIEATLASWREPIPVG